MQDTTFTVRAATTADAKAWTRANAPKVATRKMFVLAIPAPVETFGLEWEEGDPTHLLMCFETFDEAKAMQVRLFAKGISGPIEEKVFTKDVEA